MAQQQMVNLPGQAGGGLPYGSLPQGQLSSGLVSQFPQAAGTPGFQAPSLMQQQQQQIQYQHLQQQQQQQQLQLFWQQQMQEVEQATDFKNHQLPLARIKKIMKADEDVRMISAEAPVVFSKACEMFILELTLRSWIHTEENKRRTLQKNDIAGAISRTDIFDFLVDIVPRDELKEEGLGVPRAQVPIPGAELTYGGMYYMPQAPGSGPSITAPGVVPPPMMVGQPVAGLQLDATGAGAYSQPRAPMPPYMPQGMTPQMWPQQGLPGNLPPQ